MYVCMYVCTHVRTYVGMGGWTDGWMDVRTYVYGWMYVCRVKAGGSPEANCILFVWIWKMLILQCVLPCFMLFSQLFDQ